MAALHPPAQAAIARFGRRDAGLTVGLRQLTTDPPLDSIRAIEALLTKPTIVILGVLAIAAATLQPWYFAHAVAGHATMAGWGAWSTTGEVGASLRFMPLALLVYLTAGVMIYGAVRGSFGIAVVGAMAMAAVAILPIMLVPAVDRHAPGSSAVGIDVGSATTWVLVIALVATVASWIAYARCVLRAQPRAETRDA